MEIRHVAMETTVEGIKGAMWAGRMHHAKTF